MEAPKSNSSRSLTSAEVGLDSEDTPRNKGAISFRHLTCTNEDPNTCVICSGAFEGETLLMPCCGSKFCLSCIDLSSHVRYDESSVKLCAVCGKKALTTLRDGFRMELSAARKGQAWAQYEVALSFDNGNGVDQSHCEAVYWYKKAAEQGHPTAFLNLGVSYRRGEGCAANLSDAERYYKMAANLSLEFHRKQKYKGINNLALLMSDQGRKEEARDLLLSLPFPADGNAELQNHVGALYATNFSNHEEAAWWLRLAAMQGHSKAARNLVKSYMDLGRHALAKFWMNIVMKIGIGVHEGELVPNMKALRRNEEHCGACDKKLGTPKQNMCKQCRTYCYCNRLCQIRHWNRDHKYCHKIDCKEVGRLKEKEDELIELFKNEPDGWFDKYHY